MPDLQDQLVRRGIWEFPDQMVLPDLLVRLAEQAELD